MEMKKTWIILFCVVVLTAGLSAEKKADCARMELKNCARFDNDIQQSFKHYGPIGVNVELLSVVGRPISVESGYCCEVMLRVAPVVPHPKAEADTWHFCGCLIYKTTGQVPLGIRIIDKGKLIGCCKAADIVKDKFPGFQADKAEVKLYWVIYPSCTEPYYYFVLGDKLHTIGAYTGKVYN
jgi:hypothetical protein